MQALDSERSQAERPFPSLARAVPKQSTHLAREVPLRFLCHESQPSQRLPGGADVKLCNVDLVQGNVRASDCAPSTMSELPLIYSFVGSHKKTAARAISSGRANLFQGRPRLNSAICSSLLNCRSPGVSVQPGYRMLTRMRCSASSTAAVRANWSTAAFAMLYAIDPGTGINAWGELTANRAPPDACRII